MTLSSSLSSLRRAWLVCCLLYTSITGRGTVATGRVERGTLHLNEEVEIVGIKEETKKTVVTGIEMFRKMLDEAQACLLYTSRCV